MQTCIDKFSRENVEESVALVKAGLKETAMGRRGCNQCNKKTIFNLLNVNKHILIIQRIDTNTMDCVRTLHGAKSAIHQLFISYKYICLLLDFWHLKYRNLYTIMTA